MVYATTTVEVLAVTHQVVRKSLVPSHVDERQSHVWQHYCCQDLSTT